MRRGALPRGALARARLLANEPRLTEGWLLLALAEQRQQRYEAMLAALHAALRLQPTNVHGAAQVPRSAAAVRPRRRGAHRTAPHSSAARSTMRALLTALADLYASRRRARRSAALRAAGAGTGARRTRQLLASAAAAETACGRSTAAEQHLDQLLAAHPQDYGSLLPAQHPAPAESAERNHVREMSARLAALPVESRDIVPLCFALAKEYEDLGITVQAVAYLQRGAARRRRNLSYQRRRR